LLVGGVHENSTDDEVTIPAVKTVGGFGIVAAVVIEIYELNWLVPTLLIAATLKL